VRTLSVAIAASLVIAAVPALARAASRVDRRESVRIASHAPQVRQETRKYGRLRGKSFERPDYWLVAFYGKGHERVQIHVDRDTGRIREAWTGIWVPWEMARGYSGAFGRKVNAPYVWLPLCALFLVPFFDPRRPFRLLHLDLLVLLAFGASHFFFNRGEVYTSVPLVYPVLLYLLVRMLIAGFRPRNLDDPLVPLVPASVLAVGLVLLMGFRVTLNVVDSNVIDVGYASVVGADVLAHGKGLYEGGAFPEDLFRGDTYGPAAYQVYVPFELAFPWHGKWDDVPAAHAAALTFDLLTTAGLFLLGREMRAGPQGRRLGLALAFAWASYPYSLFSLETNSNDSLVAMLLVFALLGLASPVSRGAFIGVGAAAKFAPLALAPLFATAGSRRPREMLTFLGVLGAVVVFLTVPLLPDGGLREFWDRTVGFQAGRDSPFSIWNQAAGLGWLQTLLKALAIGLALLVAFLPRRKTPAQVAALGAAIVVAVVLTVEHWFYLYVVWFAPFVLVALFASYRTEPAHAAATIRPATAPQRI
jgi:glycosyl transferase family 87